MSHKPYRPCVVAVIVRDQQFLVGERSKETGVFQLPQGGIDEGETPREALLRELVEEIGTDEVEIIAEAPNWIAYDFPTDLEMPISNNYRGQEQRWFLCKLKNGVVPDLSKSDGEFKSLDWRAIDRIVDGIIYWKKQAYLAGFLALGYSL